MFPDGSYRGCGVQNGYKLVTVTINKKQKRFLVHRLVAHLFIGLDLDNHKQIINHLNHVKDDNRSVNLEIVSNRENLQKTRSHSKGRLFGTSQTNIKKNPWAAKISGVDNKPIHLGSYKTEEEAHMVAVTEYIRLYGTPPYCTCRYCI